MHKYVSTCAYNSDYGITCTVVVHFDQIAVQEVTDLFIGQYLVTYL